MVDDGSAVTPSTVPCPRMSHDPTTVTIGSEATPHLDADLWMPADPPALAVVCCHPHPQYGGSRHNHVVDAVFRSAIGSGVAALRFDFRGVGRSSGTHAGGVGEQDDVHAAIDHLMRVGADRVLLSGYSFGADVALSCDHSAVVGWFGVAAPLAVLPVGSMRAGVDDRPVWLAVPEHDQFRTVDDAARLTETWADRRIEVIPMADHFLAGSVAGIERMTTEVIGQLVRPAGGP